jgi:hypothetical protein
VRTFHNHTLKSKDIASGVLTPKLYGNFNGSTGALVRGKGIISGTKGGGNGFYIIRFKRNVSNCVLLASISSTSNINPASTDAGIAYYTGNSDPREAFVLTQDDGSTREDVDFSVAAFC